MANYLYVQMWKGARLNTIRLFRSEQEYINFLEDLYEERYQELVRISQKDGKVIPIRSWNIYVSDFRIFEIFHDKKPVLVTSATKYRWSKVENAQI
jgi:hypothetical protein